MAAVGARVKCPPPRSGPVTAGAIGPVPVLKTVVPGLAATGLWSLLAGPVVQPAASTAPPRASAADAAARREGGRRFGTWFRCRQRVPARTRAGRACRRAGPGKGDLLRGRSRQMVPEATCRCPEGRCTSGEWRPDLIRKPAAAVPRHRKGPCAWPLANRNGTFAVVRVSRRSCRRWAVGSQSGAGGGAG
jgi:hypothetical protein